MQLVTVPGVISFGDISSPPEKLDMVPLPCVKGVLVVIHFDAVDGVEKPHLSDIADGLCEAHGTSGCNPIENGPT